MDVGIDPYILTPPGKSLEEMDELFAMKLWPWQWQSAVTSGVGSAVARAEQKDTGMEKNTDIEHVSHLATILT